MSSRPIAYRPLTLHLLQKYITIDNRKIREHKRWIRGRSPHNLHDSEIPQITEMRCFACNESIKEGINVIVWTRKSQARCIMNHADLSRSLK